MELTEDTRSSAGKVTPHLKHVDEFSAVLQQYRVGAQAQQILNETKFVVLVGPSSSGRNTIINRLMERGNYHFIISDTTRPPRLNNGVLEQDGVQYWFRKEDEFLSDLKEGKYLEAEVIHGQQVSGISIRELEKAHNNDKIAITDIDIGGIYNVVQAKPDTAVILILPPNFDEWKRRLLGRSIMHDDEYRRRMETALRIFSAPAEDTFFNVVINDKLEDAIQQVDNIAHGIIDASKQADGIALAKELLANLQTELDKDVR
jgi:guanylate kinase